MNEAVESLLENQIRNLPRGTAELSLLSTEDDTSLVRIKDGNVFRESCSANPVHNIRVKQMMPFIQKAASFNASANATFLLNTCDLIKDFPLDGEYPTLCFCKTIDQNAVTIPNIDFYSGLLRALLSDTENDSPYEQKEDGSVFIGASSGWGDRMKYCESVVDSECHHGYINQMVGDRDKLERDYPNFREYTNQFRPRGSQLYYVDVKSQIRFKFVVNLDGYGLCYSRLYWQMASNSVPVYLNRNKDLIQLYDYFLEPNVHYIESTIDEWPDRYEFLINTQEGRDLCKEVSHQGKVFCNEFLNDTLGDATDVLSLVLKSLG